jgi:hypothetical protein
MILKNIALCIERHQKSKEHIKSAVKFHYILGKQNIKNRTIIQAVSEIRVLILTSGRTRQIMELFSITFLRKSNTN